MFVLSLFNLFDGVIVISFTQFNQEVIEFNVLDK